jgi:hypothetical protein
VKVWELFWSYSAEKMRWNEGLGVILELFWSYSAEKMRWNEGLGIILELFCRKNALE